jgi:hypothetical protein
MKIDRMGVLVLVSHLIITLVILGIYGFTLYTGQGDETLKTILTVIIGYWFGSMGVSAIRPNAGTQINQANEVRVMPNETTRNGGENQ